MKQTMFFRSDSCYNFIIIVTLNNTNQRHLPFHIFILFQKFPTTSKQCYCLEMFFVGVLGDTSTPMALSAYVLWSSQSWPFHYVMDLWSSIEPVSDEFRDEEQDDSEQYDVRLLWYSTCGLLQYTQSECHLMFIILYHQFSFCIISLIDPWYWRTKNFLIDGGPGSGMFLIF